MKCSNIWNSTPRHSPKSWISTATQKCGCIRKTDGGCATPWSDRVPGPNSSAKSRLGARERRVGLRISRDACEGLAVKMLFFAPHSAIWQHAFPEALAAEALQQRGHQVVYVTCGERFRTYCVAMSAHGVKPEATAA